LDFEQMMAPPQPVRAERACDRWLPSAPPAPPSRALRAAGEDGDGAAVVRAGRERAADGEFDVLGPVVAHEHEHVEHLARRLRRADLRGDLLPELVEAVGPVATLSAIGAMQ
jgi:hypothetical protein